ncbi:hypothetical protein N9B04_00690 [bacterium]|nr:hypothetical protein [bacterium]
MSLSDSNNCSMTIQPEDTNGAVRQLANGATVGMVVTLKQKGVGSGPRAEVLEIAKRIINRRARIKHLLTGVAGLIIVAGGGYWYYLCAINQNHRVGIPAVVMGAGLLLATYGIYNATQNEV